MTSDTNSSTQEVPNDELKKALVDYYNNRKPIVVLRETYDFLCSADIPDAFGLYKHTDQCELCGGDLVSAFAKRDIKVRKQSASYGTRRRTATPSIREKVVISEERFKIYYPKCSDCNHIPNPQCDCDHCEKIMASNRLELVAAYAEEYGSESPAPEIESLSAELAFYLAWFVSYGTLEELKPSSRKDVTLYNEPQRPTDIGNISQEDMAQQLMQINALCIDPNSIQNAVEMTSTTEHAFNERKLSCIIPYERNHLYKNIQKHCRNMFIEDRSSVLELIGKLYMWELLLFYYKLSEQWDLPFENPPELHTNLRFGINKLGLYKTAYCIEKSVRYGATLVHEKNENALKAARSARRGLYDRWLNRNDEKRWQSYARHRDDNTFREPKKARLAQDLFLPFTIEYGACSLEEMAEACIATNSEPANTDETVQHAEQPVELEDE